MTWKLFKKNSGIILSRECKQAIPFAMSVANRMACAESTTTPAAECNKSCKDPRGMYWLMMTKCFGELQAPIKGRILGCEKIRNFGNSSLKSLDTRGVISRTVKILAIMSLFCQLPRHVSPEGLIAFLVCNFKSSMAIPL